MRHISLLASCSPLLSLALAQCPDYSDYSQQRHPPYSTGKYQLPYQRPAPRCRTFNSTVVEDVLTRMQTVIADPDLYRLFENAYPNTLDTAIRWKGYAAGSTDEELTFIITGDINAMWLRDSANQLQSYLPLLNASTAPDSLASLYRGVINLQARYLLAAPFCNSFQPPVESGLGPSVNSAAASDTVYPPYSNASVFECKYELDSLAAFLQISAQYHAATNDTAFFGRYSWVSAVAAVVATAEAMRTPTYAVNGSLLASPYTFTRLTTRATETLANDGLGQPVGNGTGLIRSAFRPSDDSTTYQLLIPSNMQFAVHAASVASILSSLSPQKTNTTTTHLATHLRALAASIRAGIAAHAVLPHPTYGTIYAYEIDGFGASTLGLDDANLPSLLSAPFLNYTNQTTDPVYQRTRTACLASFPHQQQPQANPYLAVGPVLTAIGSAHTGPGRAWPMAAVARILTSVDPAEVAGQLGQLVASTGGLGLVHESVNAANASDWTRQWFSWANGLLGQAVLELEDRMPEVLGRSYQGAGTGGNETAAVVVVGGGW